MRDTEEKLERDLSLPLDIESERWARMATGTVRVACLAVLILIAIASSAPVREIAVAEGQLVTEQPLITVEHYDGGIVEDLFVKQGQLLEADSAILRVSRSEIESTLAQVQSRRAFTLLQRERLLALVESRQPDFSEYGADYPNLLQTQALLFASERSLIDAEHSKSQADISSREAELHAALDEVESLLAQIDIAETQLDAQRRLLQRGFATKSKMLESKATLEQKRHDLAVAQRNELSSLRAMSEVQNEQVRRTAERMQDWQEQITKLSADLAELEESQIQQLDRLGRVVVATPERAIVHELSVNGRGEVLAPGEEIATLMPVGGLLVAEVRLDPSSIGFVDIGSTAEITVTTYDKEIYGSLNGLVASISPTAVELPNEDPFYRVRLSLDRAALDGVGVTGDLLPGMQVRSEILTGEKSIMRYMMKPLVRALDRAFSER